MAQLALHISNLLVGIVPSAAFFIWVERNCALPLAVASRLGWPWLDLQGAPVLLASAIDFALILAFGFVHSATAQLPAQRAFERVAGPRGVRAVYMMITGVSVTAVMGLWQNTGVILWVLPLSWKALNLLSVLLYYGLLSGAALQVYRLNAAAFVGLTQSKPGQAVAEKPVLVETGMYRYIRHPIYFFTLSAFVITPLMSLDRAIVLAASALYLSVGIPVEERKLVKLFGEAYLAYRRRVPAVVPRLRMGLLRRG